MAPILLIALLFAGVSWLVDACVPTTNGMLLTHTSPINGTFEGLSCASNACDIGTGEPLDEFMHDYIQLLLLSVLLITPAVVNALAFQCSSDESGAPRRFQVGGADKLFMFSPKLREKLRCSFNFHEDMLFFKISEQKGMSLVYPLRCQARGKAFRAARTKFRRQAKSYAVQSEGDGYKLVKLMLATNLVKTVRHRGPQWKKKSRGRRVRPPPTRLPRP